MGARLIGAAALAMTLALPAAAQDTGAVDVTGSVAERCEFSTDSALITLGELSILGSGVTAGQLNSAAVDGASASLSGWCNGTSATMTVEAFALENQSFLASPPAGFERVVNFSATATASPGGGDVSASDASSGVGPGSPSVVGIFSSAIAVVLSASSTPGGGKLIAGNYSGSVDVTLSPSP